MEIENRKVCIEALTGSYNYNLATPNSDRDYKYFVVPTFDDLYNGKFFSTAHQSTTFDYSVHDIRKLGELIWKANINFIEVLFSKDLTFDPALRWIFENREALAMMNLPAFAHATYGMHLQKMGNLFKGTETTKPLIEKFGYDTKEACHALRCLLVLKNIVNGDNFGDAIWYEEDSTYSIALIGVKLGKFKLSKFIEMVEYDKIRAKQAVEWCEKQKPNLTLKAQLDEVIKNFVKEKLY